MTVSTVELSRTQAPLTALRAQCLHDSHRCTRSRRHIRVGRHHADHRRGGCAAGRPALGYTYSDASAVTLIRGALANAVLQRDVWDMRAASGYACRQRVRNLGRAGRGGDGHLRARLRTVGSEGEAARGAARAPAWARSRSACRSTAVVVSPPTRHAASATQLGGWVAQRRLPLGQDSRSAPSRSRTRTRARRRARRLAMPASLSMQTARSA